jgi:cytochrome c553
MTENSVNQSTAINNSTELVKSVRNGRSPALREHHQSAGSGCDSGKQQIALLQHSVTPSPRLLSAICYAICTVLAGGSLIAGVSQLAPAISDRNSIAAGYNIAVHGVSPERANCASCHLQNGDGQPSVGIPRLTGLTSSYIAAQLDYFATGARRDPMMSPYAVMLTPAERRSVADYFASLPVPQQPDLDRTDKARLHHGRELFLNGDYTTGLLSCSQCHGRTGLGVGDFSPRLAGQSADYVSQKLQQWRSGDLRDPKGNFMRAEASHLTQSDIAALAAFISSLRDDALPQTSYIPGTNSEEPSGTPALHYSVTPPSSTIVLSRKETGKP